MTTPTIPTPSEGYPASWVRVVLRVSPSGEMHAVGGDRDGEEGTDCPYPGLDRINARVHAAESQLTAIHTLLAPLLGTEPCAVSNDDLVHGRKPGTRDVIDGMGTVEAVQRVANLAEQGERATVQLAGCLTAVEGHCPDPPLTPEVYGWSLPYQKTLELHASLDTARAAVAEMIGQSEEPSLPIGNQIAAAIRALATEEK